MSPYNDSSVLGSISGSPYLGSLPFSSYIYIYVYIYTYIGDPTIDMKTAQLPFYEVPDRILSMSCWPGNLASTDNGACKYGG